MTPGRARQRGMGLFGVILAILLASFFFTLLFKLGPAYMNYWTVRSIMSDVANEPEPLAGGARAIADSLSKRMNINSLRNIDVKDFKIKRIDEGLYNVLLDYEHREHLFFNVDAVLIFTYQVDVKTS